MARTTLSLTATLLSALGLVSQAHADPTGSTPPAATATTTSSGPSGAASEKSVTEMIGLPPAGADGGFGLSVLTNVTRIFANGNYDLLSAGVGLGLSWKNKSDSRFPIELGGYVAPQFAGANDASSGAVAVIAQAMFFKGFGLGLGVNAWRKGVGFGGGDAGDRIFVTLGYGLTNDTKGSGH